jgi:nucleoside diphosphate kinase
MASLQQLLEQQQAGFTVYSPDCTQSRLWGNLDHAIQSITGFQPVYRHWINHDFNSANRFYSGPNQAVVCEEPDPEAAAGKYEALPIEELRYGHLMMKLLLAGPSLLTIWQGNNAVATLLALKGVTHPAEASPTSIRGRFWCDNAISNLIHVSDDESEAERELRAVHLWDLLDEKAISMPLLEAITLPSTYVAHSGIAVVCELMNRLLFAMEKGRPIGVELPPSGDAKQTNELFTATLQDLAVRLPDSVIARFIKAYLAGDLVTVTGMLKTMPVTKWEHLIIQCGAISRDKWNQAEGDQSG